MGCMLLKSGVTHVCKIRWTQWQQVKSFLAESKSSSLYCEQTGRCIWKAVLFFQLQSSSISHTRNKNKWQTSRARLQCTWKSNLFFPAPQLGQDAGGLLTSPVTQKLEVFKQALGFQFRTNKRRYFLMRQAVEPWNSSPKDSVDATFVHGFGSKLGSSRKRSPSRLTK